MDLQQIHLYVGNRLFHTEYGCELAYKPPKRGTRCTPFL
ncbi:hypothetical protein BAXH7_04058 [Bacillus amyloliquefaciens XH7]|nr:hypothetical protein LL3_04063 [Bacillus amyloliquefaciens LL3]AEK91166.1 hypothetical protein BAXH7_04058 [Bacillus amyloliquefaciens XH7]KYC98689.1 hypothetical protein B425_3151 [Bacillus amyloliquefaciens]